MFLVGAQSVAILGFLQRKCIEEGKTELKARCEQ
jgi:hypothetical protein